MAGIIGKVLGGRYEIIEKIGEGGMALVYKARCRLLNRYVAVKILRDELTTDEEFINKFRRESQAAASLSHPNIVGIYDVGVEDDIHYIVMEYIKGKTLKEIIDEKGKLTSKETINYAMQIAEALGHAHKNHIVHRDIKPHNIMVTDDGRIKVTDFGIARAATSATMTNTSSVIGSVHYFSPEQARGKFTDEKSDIYSLGIVMYEMITGKVPFQGESPISVALKHVEEEITLPSSIDSSVPKNIEHIIMKCAKKNQIERYKNTEELLGDLRKVKYSNRDINFNEHNNIADSQTKILPAIKSDKIEDKKQQKKEPKKRSERKKNKNGSKKVVFLGILLAFLLVNGIAFGLLKLKDVFMTKEMEVPDLVGIQEEVAKEKLEDMGLKFVVKERPYSSKFKEGEIMWQSEEPGKKVKKGYSIEVNVSKGEKLIKVPKLIGKDVNEIDFILDESNFKRGNVDYQHSDSVPKNIVISQNPAPGQKISEGSEVDIVVSKGQKKVKVVSMPKLVGLKENEAKRAVIASGLAVGKVNYEPNDNTPKGVVIWQGYKQGAELQKNTNVDLIVSSGPRNEDEKKEEEPRKEEPRKEEPKKEPKKELKKEPKKEPEASIPVTIQLPRDKEQVEIKIVRTQDGANEQVYGGTHNTSEGSITVNVKGKKNAKIDVYCDGAHCGTYSIN